MTVLWIAAVLAGQLLFATAAGRWLRRRRQELEAESDRLDDAVAGIDRRFADIATEGPLVRLVWVEDVPVATIVTGDALAVALWLHQVKDGVSIRV